MFWGLVKIFYAKTDSRKTCLTTIIQSSTRYLIWFEFCSIIFKIKTKLYFVGEFVNELVKIKEQIVLKLFTSNTFKQLCNNCLPVFNQPERHVNIMNRLLLVNLNFLFYKTTKPLQLVYNDTLCNWYDTLRNISLTQVFA